MRNVQYPIELFLYFGHLVHMVMQMAGAHVLNIQVTADLLRSLDEYRERDGLSRAAAVRVLLRKQLNREQYGATVRDAKGRELS